MMTETSEFPTSETIDVVLEIIDHAQRAITAFMEEEKKVTLASFMFMMNAVYELEVCAAKIQLAAEQPFTEYSK